MESKASLEEDVVKAQGMRAKIKKLDRRISAMRNEVHALEQFIFKRCPHEWVQMRTQDEEVMVQPKHVPAFWYNYCPWTCKHCNFFRSGPVKY